jgi:Restriction endonuclease
MLDLYDLERRLRSASRDLRDAEERAGEAYRYAVANPADPKAVDAYHDTRRRARAELQKYKDAQARLDGADGDVARWEGRANRARKEANRTKFWTEPRGFGVACAIEVVVLGLVSFVVLALKVPVLIWAVAFLVVAMGAASLTYFLLSARKRMIQPELDELEGECEEAERSAEECRQEQQAAAKYFSWARGLWERADRELQDMGRRVRPVVAYDEATDDLNEAREWYELARKRYEEAQAGRRLQLLRCEWEYFKDREFELFIRDVFECLGYRTELTPKTGDQGIDVIAEKGGVRWGIQCKGYSNPLGNKPVQEAVAGIRFYKCDRCMVITTSRFTSGGCALAEANDCVLVEGRDIPCLIKGDLGI